MTIYGTILPGATSIASSAFLAGNLTERMKYRIRVLDWHRNHSSNTSLAARHFGLTRETIIPPHLKTSASTIGRILKL